MGDGIFETERVARQAIADLQREYHLRAQPYIDILMRIQACKTPAPIIVDWEEWERIPQKKSPASEGEG